jgi:hypothetical protein
MANVELCRLNCIRFACALISIREAHARLKVIAVSDSSSSAPISSSPCLVAI